MKKIIFGTILSTLFVLFSCSSEEDTPEPTPVTGSTMSANVNGNAWSSLQGAVVASVIDGGSGGDFQRTLQITGSSLSMTSMSISIPIQDLSTGSQSFSGDFAPGFLSYFNGSSFFVSQHTSGNFTVNITALNLIDGKISGTFSGTLYDDNDVAMNVTNGVFTDVTIYSTNFFSNGSMALKRNGGTLFTMDGTTEDLKYLTITQSNANNSISLFGNNSTFTSDAGIYNVNFPKDVAAGTYTLTNTGTYSAGLGNSDSEPEYTITGGSLTISSHNGNTVVGTFNYTANNGVQTVTISNGSFSITHN